MDWKYKHFGGARAYPQPQAQVLTAAQTYMAQTLGWQVTDAPDGFVARGASFAHNAVAGFHVGDASEGARIVVELAVERAGLMGFMLFDVGGYYNGQIAHWLEGIDDQLAGRVGANAPHRPPSSGAKLLSWLLLIAVVGFGIWAAWNLVVAPIIGLATGDLYLTGRGGDLTLHGAWARGVSAGLLALDVFLVFLLLRRRPRPPFLGRG